MEQKEKESKIYFPSLFSTWKFWFWIGGVFILILIWIWLLKTRTPSPPPKPPSPPPLPVERPREPQPPQVIDLEKLPPEQKKILEDWAKKLNEELKKELEKRGITELPPPPPPPSFPPLP